MLDFLWSGASKSARRDLGAQGGPVVEGPAREPEGGASEESNPPAPGEQAEVAEGPTVARPRASSAGSSPANQTLAADAGDLPTAFGLARLSGRLRGRRLGQPGQPKAPLTAPQRLLLLDTWRRSGLPAGDFAALVGLSKHTLYAWKKKFDRQGPAGLLDQPRGGPTGSKLPELTKRTILMLKEDNPCWGCQRISDMLLRGPALPASPAAVSRVLQDRKSTRL